MSNHSSQRLPEWVRGSVRGLGTAHEMKARLRGWSLHTVCESARCPNISECFQRKTATVMILGDVCTRGCAFCAVQGGIPLPPDPEEPGRVADMAEQLGLRHLVITSVTRDDLEDGGAAQFATCVEAAKRRISGIVVEILTPDFQMNQAALAIVAASAFDVFNHNLETVRRLQKSVRPAADYDRSLSVLNWMSGRRLDAITKSGIMVGLGETDEEIAELLRDIRAQGVTAITIGQYLRPTSRNAPVDRYVTPEQFDQFAALAREIGFEYVASGPLVRSSYMAEQFVRREKH